MRALVPGMCILFHWCSNFVRRCTRCALHSQLFPFITVAVLDYERRALAGSVQTSPDEHRSGAYMLFTNCYRCVRSSLLPRHDGPGRRRAPRRRNACLKTTLDVEW
jgi:hypothetical protein